MIYTSLWDLWEIQEQTYLFRAASHKRLDSQWPFEEARNELYASGMDTNNFVIIINESIIARVRARFMISVNSWARVRTRVSVYHKWIGLGLLFRA